ncbi:stage II sporulation protein SA [Sporosarcina globispora]|uniref:Stage II sporulation protein SA n=1 Tax=Sporosarcina globispora TaxID=1459 RepID=A0A0M0GFV8_SPOGL|nr:type II toxin-antitoxin system SpoIISA family toxin [Sporosarcina globispora]KON88321.1 stage II sporulation protein SA [Sporosarcina globispora]
MLLFFKIAVWMIVACLGFYVFSVWKWEKRVKERMFAIRKTWYILYVVGAVIYWTKEPVSIFTDWLNYLIVAIIFALVDAFIFLGSYLKRVGNNELATDTMELLEENNDLLNSQMNKLKSFQYLLKNEPIDIYYGEKEAYIAGIEKLLADYAEKVDMKASLCKYTTQEDKDYLLEHYPDKALIHSRLGRKEVYYDADEKLALIPFSILEDDYVIKLTSDDFVTEFDYLLFTSLISIYDLMLPAEQEDEDHEGTYG